MHSWLQISKSVYKYCIYSLCGQLLIEVRECLGLWQLAINVGDKLPQLRTALN